MTHDEVSALIDLALRAPRSQSETLWLVALMQRWDAERRKAQSASAGQPAANGAAAQE